MSEPPKPQSFHDIDSHPLVFAAHCSLMDFERLVFAEMHSKKKKTHNSSQALNFLFLHPSEIWLNTGPAQHATGSAAPTGASLTVTLAVVNRKKKKKKRSPFQLRVGGINANWKTLEEQHNCRTTAASLTQH